MFAASDAALTVDADGNSPEFWDELAYWLELMSRTSRESGETMLEAVMRAMTVPEAYHYGDILAQMLRYKDSLILDQNDINNSPSNSFASALARLTVITCSGRPDRYIVFSFASKTGRKFSTSSVFESFTPNSRPHSPAMPHRFLSIGTASV